jgi:hypothetical protein
VLKRASRSVRLGTHNYGVTVAADKQIGPQRRSREWLEVARRIQLRAPDDYRAPAWILGWAGFSDFVGKLSRTI